MARYPYRITVSPSDDYLGRLVDFPDMPSVIADSPHGVRQKLPDALLAEFQRCANNHQPIPMASRALIPVDDYIYLGPVISLKIALNNILVEQGTTILNVAKTLSLSNTASKTVLKALDFQHDSSIDTMVFIITRLGYDIDTSVTKKI